MSKVYTEVRHVCEPADQYEEEEFKFRFDPADARLMWRYTYPVDEGYEECVLYLTKYHNFILQTEEKSHRTGEVVSNMLTEITYAEAHSILVLIRKERPAISWPEMFVGDDELEL